MNSFKPWLLKNVETRDQSAPNFWDLKHLNSINKFEKSSLAPARVSKSKPTKLFVSELLQKEICGFDRSSLKTTKSEEQEVNENSRVPVRTIKFKIIFSQHDHFSRKPSNFEFWISCSVDLEKFNEWLSENIDGFSDEISALRMALSKTIANEVATFDRKKLKSTKSESEEDAFTDYITDIRKSVISEVEQFQSANLSPRKTIEKESVHFLSFNFLSLRSNHGSQF